MKEPVDSVSGTEEEERDMTRSDATSGAQQDFHPPEHAPLFLLLTQK